VASVLVEPWAQPRVGGITELLWRVGTVAGNIEDARV